MHPRLKQCFSHRWWENSFPSMSKAQVHSNSLPLWSKERGQRAKLSSPNSSPKELQMAHNWLSQFSRVTLLHMQPYRAALGSHRVAAELNLCPCVCIQCLSHRISLSSPFPWFAGTWASSGVAYVVINVCRVNVKTYKFKSLEEEELLLSSSVLKPTLPSRGPKCSALPCSHMLNHLVAWAVATKWIAY